jgi:thermostable 8-oxoguanine DNA glycosylase
MDPANANTLIYSEDNHFLTNVSLVNYAIVEKAPMSITPAEGHYVQALTG